MDGISVYTHVSQGWQKPDMGVGQQRPDSTREDRSIERNASGSEGRSETPGRVQDKVTLSAEAQQKLRDLSARDREVRAHEAAHAAVGGRFAGPPRLSYQEGPDGRRYAVEGKVNIDVSEVPGDPDRTLEKADLIKRAALAPQNPSSADRAIAGRATQMAAEARMKIAAEKNESLQNDFKSALVEENTGENDVFQNNKESNPEQPDFKIQGQLLSVRA